MAAARAKDLWLPAAAGRAEQGRSRHDHRERQLQQRNGTERGGRQQPQPAIGQRARANTMGGLQHNRRDRWLETVEHGRHRRHSAKADIDPRQADQQQQRWQHEQHASSDTAGSPMQQPANIDRELLRFGAGQQHAVVQGMQKAPFRDPAPALDQLLMHDRNLSGWSTATDEPESQPLAQCAGEARSRGRRRQHAGSHGLLRARAAHRKLRHPVGVPPGRLCAAAPGRGSRCGFIVRMLSKFAHDCRVRT